MRMLYEYAIIILNDSVIFITLKNAYSAYLFISIRPYLKYNDLLRKAKTINKINKLKVFYVYKQQLRASALIHNRIDKKNTYSLLMNISTII